MNFNATKRKTFNAAHRIVFRGKGISFGGLTRSHIKGHAAAAGTRDMDMLLDSLLMNPFNC